MQRWNCLWTGPAARSGRHGPEAPAPCTHLVVHTMIAAACNERGGLIWTGSRHSMNPHDAHTWRSLRIVPGKRRHRAPFYVSHGDGPYIYDLDGREYVDMCMSHGAALLVTTTRDQRRGGAALKMARSVPTRPNTSLRSHSASASWSWRRDGPFCRFGHRNGHARAAPGTDRLPGGTG